MWFIQCSKCGSVQTSITMHRGYNCWYCENCHSYLNANGEVLSEEYFKED